MAKRIYTTLIVRHMRSRLQSAMEYLMTYGWAILVIAVVLGVLYSLGIFSPSNFAPKASPGSCQVFRPNGPGTGYDLNLEGTCSGELPQYVAEFDGKSSLIRFQGSFPAHITLVAWIYPINTSIGTVIAANGPYYLAFGNSQISKSDCVGGGVLPSGGAWTWVCGNSDIPLSRWSQIAMTYNGSEETVYLNGKKDGSIGASNALNSGGGTLYIGWAAPGINQYFYGSVSNVQLYNESLSANGLYTLYLEGIGGAPIELPTLTAWWPLNGNENDYSGNNNNGVSTNVLFTGSWQSGYTAP